MPTHAARWRMSAVRAPTHLCGRPHLSHWQAQSCKPYVCQTCQTQSTPSAMAEEQQQQAALGDAPKKVFSCTADRLELANKQALAGLLGPCTVLRAAVQRSHQPPLTAALLYRPPAGSASLPRAAHCAPHPWTGSAMTSSRSTAKVSCC